MEGQTQYDILTELKGNDLTKGIGTFIGYEHDEQKKPMDSPSHLDYIFASPEFECVKPVVLLPEERPERDELPSDHLGVFVELNLN